MATCNYINYHINPKHTSATKIQKLIYADAKVKSGMQASHVIQACIRVAGNRKVANVSEFKPGSVLYDARTFSLARDLQTASLSGLTRAIPRKTAIAACTSTRSLTSPTATAKITIRHLRKTM